MNEYNVMKLFKKFGGKHVRMLDEVDGKITRYEGGECRDIRLAHDGEFGLQGAIFIEVYPKSSWHIVPDHVTETTIIGHFQRAKRTLKFTMEMQ